MTQATVAEAGEGRRETELERRDRNLAELLQELRVVQTGVQVLFAFLLTVPFTQRFDALDDAQRALYFATMLATGLAIVLLLAPMAWHRMLFECGDKSHLVHVSHRFAVAGLVCVGASMCGAVLLIATLIYPGAGAAIAAGALALVCLLAWGALPLRRRLRIRGRAIAGHAHPGKRD